MKQETETQTNKNISEDKRHVNRVHVTFDNKFRFLYI